MSSEDRTTDSAEGAADQPSLARPVEEIRADLARAASPYYCGGGPVADRLATDAASLLSRLAAVEREAAELRDIADSAIIQRDAAVSQLANTQAQLDEQKRLTESARRWGRSQYEVACADRRLYNQRTMEVRAAEARIEAAQKRPRLVDLVNLTQQECYDKGRADVLAALASPLPPEEQASE